MRGTSTGYDIAVIGAAGRFPGARNLAEFWRNVRDGVESVTFFTDQELIATGESPAALSDPAYVKAQPLLDDFDRFDAGLFGFAPQDAAVMDPQHRVFLEVGWEALECAGHEPESFAGQIGVFATCGMNTYMMYHLVNNRRIMNTVGEWLVRHTGNDMNFLATRLSYELNLKGPSMNVQTACSSALVAIHLACQSLLGGECDMALAGGSTIVLPQGRGYFYKEGEILSPDGHCRPFDARARGTLFGSGAGIVVLRRLADAEADGDQILAIIKGSALTNDGSDKVGYLAPGVEGQSKAIVEALTISEVDPATISYVETHGTGTMVGDPIEFVALTEAFRQFTGRCGFCAIGSLKSNIGHLGEAAGIAAFIKTVLALQNRQIPPSLHFESPNPEIDFASSPFYVNTKLMPWVGQLGARRAGVTSLGVGGTNCHVILEEPAASLERAELSRAGHLLLFSAHTASALKQVARNLAGYLRETPDANLADVAFTLHAGRKRLRHRRAIFCRDCQDAIEACESNDSGAGSRRSSDDGSIVFLFPGQGAQYAGMGRGLYESEPEFKAEVDRCAEILGPYCGMDVREAIFGTDRAGSACDRLNQTEVTQPALFVIEYALAKLWMHWGAQVRAMIGHSVGEYVAACLAGVFSLDDALKLVADRGRLAQRAQPGSMLAVAVSAQEIARLVAEPGPGPMLSLAAINAPESSVVAGPVAAIAEFERRFAVRGVFTHRLQTSRAFHSGMMAPILASFRERIARVSLHPPTIPYLSNLTGTWIRPEEAVDPEYWTRHLRSTVRFSDCVGAVLASDGAALLEVGPGRTLIDLARQQPRKPAALLSSLPRRGENAHDLDVILRTYGRLWELGCKLEAARFYEGQRRRRVALPTYPFERARFWIEPDAPGSSRADHEPDQHALSKIPDIANWFFLPVWKRSQLPAAESRPLAGSRNWLLFVDECGLGSDLIEQLHQSTRRETISDPIRLDVAPAGEGDGLRFEYTARHQPGPGEVEIHVGAAALNFADVLKATGVLPEAPFGMECAGVIKRVGAGVSHFRPGDEVVAIGPDSFRSYVVRDARFVARKPDFLSLEDAVTLPAAFMTAWYALDGIGKLTRGEKVLIHAASGGVGLAAVQVARLAGAEVLATAGSDEKRRFLNSLGIRAVFDSRSLDFAQSVMKWTRGTGVNVVLNSLTGEFIPKGFEVLAQGGRFVEIGKKEIYSPEHLAKLKLRSNITYHPIDLTRLYRDDPDQYGALLRDVVKQAAERRFEPLPRHEFAFGEASQAFELMTQTRHIGKVILSMHAPCPEVYTVRPGSGFQRLGKREFVVHPDCEADYHSLFQVLDGEGAAIGQIVHLWNVPVDARGRDPIRTWLDRGFLSLTALAKALGSQGWEQPIDLAVVSTGSQQIAGETRLEPVKATLRGPCRVIPREFANVSCRSIDVPETRPLTRERERVVRQLLAELLAGPPETVVAYRNGIRWVQTYESAPLGTAGTGLVLRYRGVYLITGGLGGLGLAFAEYLAQKVQAKLVLVSRTSLPPRAEWERWLETRAEAGPISTKIRKLLECERAGASLFATAADITDRKSMRAVIAETHKRFGAIDGVIHAAGAVDDGLIQLKTRDSALAVLAPKVKGSLVLDEALGDEPRDFFALFSSVSSILGIEGQVDYSAANAFLDAFAVARSTRAASLTVAINWSAWRQVGMAARRERGPRGREDLRGQPRHPWLEQRRSDGSGTVFTAEFSRSRHWLLDEHRIGAGCSILPGTGFLELACAGLLEVDAAAAIEISRVIFQAPFVVADVESRELSLTLRPAESGWDFQIQSDRGRVTHVTGCVAACKAERPAHIDIEAAGVRCNVRTESVDGFLKQDFLIFGRRWGNVQRIQFSRSEALLTLELPSEFAADLESLRLHPALLDMATGGALALIPDFDAAHDFYIPFSYGRLVLWGGLPRKLYSFVRLRDASARELAVFDVTITDRSGQVVAEISEFVMKRVANRNSLEDHRAAHEATTSSPAAGLAEQALVHGIEPEEGIEAFQRILAAGIGPQVVVSSVDIQLWNRLANPPQTKNPAGIPPLIESGLVNATVRAGRARKETGAPVEGRLANMYSEILGVANVGPRDDFFELGGHSLLAVRLLARIEREFKKAIPLPALFQSATIEHLATYLHVDGNPSPDASSAIVPLNDQGEGPAFYCVHSVGGEVMSFRHLANDLGPDQRFYGIQAPPELRGPEFASSIEAMASYYVDELVRFQPEGPYLLGGWSAGSAIALEMAHQMRAADRPVDLLVAIDGVPPGTGAGTSRWNPAYYWKLFCNVPGWAAEDLLVDFSFGRFARRVGRKLVSLAKRAAANARGDKNRHEHTVAGFMDTSDFSDRQFQFMGALFSALHAYKAKPYPGRVLLFKARTEPLYHLLEVDKRWAKVARHLEVVPVKGTHDSVVREPYVRAVADQLKKALSAFHHDVAQTAETADMLA
jgi:acyl transferase domain-containing protein/NADPH:quinone reductase-like Zn-dependent oxidoreductase/thioesterase domain-containing protein/NADP-dependent 3-hydroxy acid dehydrogenase YdfG/acyl carrier protein